MFFIQSAVIFSYSYKTIIRFIPADRSTSESEEHSEDCDKTDTSSVSVTTPVKQSRISAKRKGKRN